jgi:hypothetical protein
MAKKRIQKANAGLQNVVVPEKGSNANLLSSGLSMASTGASLLPGPLAPWGAAAGAVAGIGMGLLEKKKADEAYNKAKDLNIEREAMRQMAGTQAVQGGQTFKRGTKNMAGSKQIEVEKDEMVFRKSGNRFVKVADFKGGKTHEKGGEPYIAMDGDIIFPGKDRGKVESAYKSGDNARLESMRRRLPKDTNPKGEARQGLDNDGEDDRIKMLEAIKVLEQAAINDPNKYSKAFAVAKEKYLEKYSNNTDYDNSAPGNKPIDEVPADVYKREQDIKNMKVDQASLVPNVNLKTEKGASDIKPSALPSSSLGNIKGATNVPATKKEQPLVHRGLKMDDESARYKKKAEKQQAEIDKNMKSVEKGVKLQQSMDIHKKITKQVGAVKKEGDKGPAPLGFMDNIATGWGNAMDSLSKFAKDNINAYTGVDASRIQKPGTPYTSNVKKEPQSTSTMSTMQDLLPTGMNSKTEAPAVNTPAVTGGGGRSGGNGGSSTGGGGKKTTPKSDPVNPLKVVDSLNSKVSDITKADGKPLASSSVPKVGDVSKMDLKETSALPEMTVGQKLSAKWNGVEEGAKGMDIGNALALAGVTNNLIQSFGKTEDVKPNYINPELIKYKDRSQTARNASNAAMAGQVANARNLSGGSASNLRANATQAFADNATRHQDISNNESLRADQIDAQNVALKNRANEFNAGALTQAQDIQRRNEAAKQSYREQALNDLGAYSQVMRKEKYTRMRDDKLDLADKAKLEQMNQWTNYAFGDGSNIAEYRGPRYTKPPVANTATTTVKTTGNTKVTTKTKKGN